MSNQVYGILSRERIQASTEGLAKWATLPTRLGVALTRRRLLVVFGVGLLLTAIEMIDHYDPVAARPFPPEFWHRIPIYALLVPLYTWILLEWAERSHRQYDETVLQVDRLNSLRVALLEAASWDELLNVIIQYPRLVMPVRATALYVANAEVARFKHAARWPAIGKNQEALQPELSLHHCASCLAAQTSTLLATESCPVSPHETGANRFCAQLVYKGQLVALLHVDLPVGHDASRYEVETLRRALPEMALALMNIRLERFLSDQVEANSELVVKERQRIAQDLHDTLAPNISYLRLKLDQLSCEGTLHDILEIQQDIERMHDAATEAYKQIRGTLTVLGPDAPGDLPEAIRECALRVGERAGFAVAMEHRPDRLPLDPAVRRELLFICREALNNVEKHAGAQQVTIRIHGDKRELQVSIADDGKGFDRDQAPPDGHFGLAVMRRRADAIGATLTVASAAGRGTHVELRIPVAGFDAGDLPDASRKGGRADSSV